jgi:hypothetical protein
VLFDRQTMRLSAGYDTARFEVAPVSPETPLWLATLDGNLLMLSPGCGLRSSAQSPGFLQITDPAGRPTESYIAIGMIVLIGADAHEVAEEAENLLRDAHAVRH